MVRAGPTRAPQTRLAIKTLERLLRSSVRILAIDPTSTPMPGYFGTPAARPVAVDIGIARYYGRWQIDLMMEQDVLLPEHDFKTPLGMVFFEHSI